MTDLQQLVAGVAKTGEFTLASGRTSTFYFDGKELMLTPAGSLAVGERLADWVTEDGVDAVGGPELGACPIVTAIGVIAAQRGQTDLRLFYVRKQPKGHGTNTQIEGPELPDGCRAVMIEDTMTTGGSLLRAVEVVRAAGITVDLAYCIVDREEGAREALEAAGIRLRALFRRSELQPSTQG